ncbi:MAG: type II toxin-antitoxin system HigB family toxin [Nitrospirae bacterium]|nr:type II toxin-antitoxin system HigB family toxin [Nitrospirota bacterium]
MTLVGREKLYQFITKHPDTRSLIENWIADVQNANWQNTQDVKDRYSSASFLADRIVIFNVRGNSYRLEVQIAYKTKKVIVKWAGTHAEYSKRFK